MSRKIESAHVTYSDEAKLEKQNGDGKLIFTKVKNRDCAALIHGGRLKAIQVITDENDRIGSVYIGKIHKVVPNLDACFVEISGGEICFLPLREAKKFFRCSQVSINRKNKNMLCQGDEILVQIIREAQKNKQATLTAHVSLSNEAAAIGIGSNKVGYSSKLNKEKKTHFKQLLEANGYVKSGIFTVPELIRGEIKNYVLETLNDTGMVVRTLASQMEDAQFLKAVNQLLRDYFELLVTSRHRICFSCIKDSAPPFVNVIEKMVSDGEYSEIITDMQSLFEKLNTYENSRISGKPVRLYRDEMLELKKLYSLETKLDEAFSKKVWMKSGAYLVIEHTEAMTVIDVNSGKCEAGSETEYEFKINLEAAIEIAIQLRLRNISGIIIVDFINMKELSQREALMENLQKAVSQDIVKCSVVDMTALGLVEMTRKKDQKPLWEQFS